MQINKDFGFGPTARYKLWTGIVNILSLLFGIADLTVEFLAIDKSIINWTSGEGTIIALEIMEFAAIFACIITNIWATNIFLPRCCQPGKCLGFGIACTFGLKTACLIFYMMEVNETFNNQQSTVFKSNFVIFILDYVFYTLLCVMILFLFICYSLDYDKKATKQHARKTEKYMDMNRRKEETFASSGSFIHVEFAHMEQGMLTVDTHLD